MERYISKEPFHPGEYIKDGMEAVGWTQDDLAEILGRSRQHVNRLLLGKTAITPVTAHELAKAFCTTPELWMNLQTSYELAVAQKEDNDIQRRAKIYSKIPIRDVRARQWIGETRSIDDLEDAVCRLLRISDISQEPTLKAAARMSTNYGQPANGAQMAWMCRARELAEMCNVAQFNQSDFEHGITDLRSLAGNPEDVRRVPKVLAELGVRFVLLEHLPKSKMDGVAFWVNDSPAIALSLRFDRLDNFWFTLMHELVHIKYQDVTVIDVELEHIPTGLPEEEKRANDEAADILIPKDKLESFIKRVHPLYYRDRVMEFARARGVHPSIVAGQLGHRDASLYRKFVKLQSHVREYLLGQAITDGWGNTP